jgi:hypothetical protein
MPQTTVRRSAVFLKTQAKYNTTCSKCHGPVNANEKCVQWRNRDGNIGTICTKCVEQSERENQAKIDRIQKRLNKK